MNIVTVVGARPQFIKAATVSRAIRAHNQQTPHKQIREVILHTGQHYDTNMSQVFFDELDIPRPDYNLEIGGGLHGEMTGKMLQGIEHILLKEKPDWVLVYGDTNSTMAGALAAVKLHIPVAHVEAGLRSFNNRMPEEINRIVADRLSTLLFCPTETAVKNLDAEGTKSGVHQVGDVMYDASLFYRDIAREKSRILEEQDLEEGAYALATIHRAENTDDPERLTGIIQGLAAIAEELRVVLPLHPRTRKCMDSYGLSEHVNGVRLIDPVPFLDMVRLEQSAKVIFTDSGGVQKEAYFFRVPCITLRDETEWVETVEAGYNVLVGANSQAMILALNNGLQYKEFSRALYGDGRAAEKTLALLQD